MGFDKLCHDDHSHMEDNINYVAMNVEIIEDTLESTVPSPARHRASVEKLHTGYSEEQFEYETMTERDSVNNGTTIYTECGPEHLELFLLQDEKLVKPGDKFESHDAFVQYVNENAKRWNFYYSCYDSRKPNTENESYIYNCVYLRNKEKYKKKGLRKRNNTLKTDCPCKIKLRRLPNENELTVVFVCNHHDHKLSAEQFYQLQHGRRLPPYIKEEILDFLTLRVNKRKIRDYVEKETGLRMSRPFFYTLERNMRKEGRKKTFTEDRLKLLHAKIVDMDAVHSKNDEDKIENQTKSWDEVTSTSSTEQDQQSEVSYNETLQSINNLQKVAKCEILKNPWIPDQCVPVLPSRTDVQEPQSEVQEQESGIHQIVEYDENIQEINDLNEHNNDVNSQNDIDDIAYETVVIEGDNQEIVEQIQYANTSTEIIDGIAIDNSGLGENIVSNIEEETVEIQYENEDLINYTVTEETQHDVAIQANMNVIDTGQTVLPVFDVYMKDGNVMGFVVNDNVVNSLKEGVDEAIQTSEDIIYSDTQEIEDEDSEIIENSNGKTVDTYKKHEYIHRYNIEHYMSQPHFPNYVEMLAKETHMDVLNMFTNIYNEKAMFKLTTTQKGNEGNTRIRYITHNGKIRKKKTDDSKREKFGRNLQSIFILKEKIRLLKKENEKVLKRNEYLQDVALKLVNMR